ncbi:effector-associated constant component EACC1 [Streptomyces sp. PBH53]|uniref:effector-associated constant component EACC1 n=1 Tax=Streptomyces sp. PBH53 TaxID=1577075 RepID=UPI000A50BEA2|nr:hypothetical protein [Streptomyces sp. PBH53]
MELRVRVVRTQSSGDVDGWTESFADWITEDRRLSRAAVVRRVRVPPGDGGMSAGQVDWINLAVDSGAFLTGLIGLFGTFRGSLARRERQAARLVVEYGGNRYIIDEETPEDAVRVARALGLAPERNGEGPGRAPS